MHRLIYKEHLATKRKNPILDKAELNEEELFLKQQQEMARAAEAIRKKDEVKSRYMHDKEINKEGKMLRYQVKSVKDSVKLKQMTVETGNQIILKYIQNTNENAIKSARNLCTGTHKDLMKIINKENTDSPDFRKEQEEVSRRMKRSLSIAHFPRTSRK